MSEEVVRRFFAALDTGDMDVITGVLDKDIEWVVPATLPDGGTYRGADTVLADLFGRRNHTWGDVEVRREHWHVCGDTVVVEGRFCGTSPQGRSYEVPFCNVMKVQGGKIVLFRNHTDTAAALTAIA